MAELVLASVGENKLVLVSDFGVVLKDAKQFSWLVSGSSRQLLSTFFSVATRNASFP
jgi:hypothetical protein